MSFSLEKNSKINKREGWRKEGGGGGVGSPNESKSGRGGGGKGGNRNFFAKNKPPRN